jgi:hypothetical protein
MTFLAPLLLFGTALAAAPVIIHLLNRRRFKRIPWAAMDFLAAVTAQTARRLKVDQLLLLVLRTLIILLVALGVARPFLSGTAATGAAEAIILVDTSASMGSREAAGSLFDFARARVREILSGLGQGSRALVITFDSEARLPAGLEPSADPKTITDAVDNTKPGFAGTSYSAALDAAERASKSFASGAPAVFIVSDFRLGGKLPAAASAPRLPGPVYLVPVADADGEDVGVVSINAAGELFTASAGQLAVTVANNTTRKAALPLSVSVDGAALGAVGVDLDQFARVTATVPAKALEAPGAHLVEASLPADAYDGDDRAWAVITRSPLQVSVSARGDSLRFLTAALSAAPADAFVTANASPETIASSMTSPGGGILASELPTSDPADAVWRHVRDGAFLVVFLDPQNPPAASEFLAASGDGDLAQLIASTAPLEGEFHPSPAGAHPVTEFLKASPEVSLASVTLSRILDIGAAKTQAVETPVTVDTPAGPRAFGPRAFLAFARIGKGRVAIFNCPADRSAGNFVASPFFVPLLFETLHYVSGGGEMGTGLVCGEPAAIALPEGKAPGDVDGPDGKVAAKTVTSDGGASAVFMPMVPGFYRAAGVAVAVNVPAAEADLRLAPRGDVERAFGGSVLESGDLASKVSRSSHGFEVSSALFIAAAILLGLEMAFVAFLRRPS